MYRCISLAVALADSRSVHCAHFREWKQIIDCAQAQEWIMRARDPDKVRCRRKSSPSERRDGRGGFSVREIGCDEGTLKMQVCMAEWRINMHRRRSGKQDRGEVRSANCKVTQILSPQKKKRGDVGLGAVGPSGCRASAGPKCAKERN